MTVRGGPKGKPIASAVTDGSGIGRLRVTEAGRWRICFELASAAPDGASYDVELRTATLTFTVGGEETR